MNTLCYGFDTLNPPENISGMPARITAVHRNLFEIVCEAGAGFAHLKTSEYFAGGEEHPTVGDFVMLDWCEDGESRITKTLPRTTYFSRRDPSSSGHKEQAVAANFDYVFIVQSLDHDFNERRLERYLTLAWQSGAIPAVILTKADALDDCGPFIRRAEQLALGTGVFALSAHTGAGLEQIDSYLIPGKTAVLLGSSGVGKSSLINALAGKMLMATSSVREKDGRGRHTTSHRQLILLENGAMLIDTPGMRELGMWAVDEGIGQSFSDIESYFGSCKFRNCRHQDEPGCAITQAIRAGDLSQDRWESYLKLNAEARYSEDKEGFMREKRAWEKDIAKQVRRIKEGDYRHTPCVESFTCKECGSFVVPEEAGSQHRNHCPQCLSSLHVDNKPGDRASLCKGVMEPIGVWVRKNGEWAIVHRCKSCGTLNSNRIAADDNSTLLMSIAMKPLAAPPFPLAGFGSASPVG